MTRLSSHIRISGNSNVFNKQKNWNTEDANTSRKNHKRETFKDPTVWFTMVVSSEMDPKEIIERITHEWSRNGGTWIMIKELQDLDSETVVSIFKISTATRKDIILAELKRILNNAQAIADSQGLEVHEQYDFSMELDVPLGEFLPPLNLRLQNAKL